MGQLLAVEQLGGDLGDVQLLGGDLGDVLQALKIIFRIITQAEQFG